MFLNIMIVIKVIQESKLKTLKSSIFILSKDKEKIFSLNLEF